MITSATLDVAGDVPVHLLEASRRRASRGGASRRPRELATVRVTATDAVLTEALQSSRAPRRACARELLAPFVARAASPSSVPARQRACSSVERARGCRRRRRARRRRPRRCRAAAPRRRRRAGRPRGWAARRRGTRTPSPRARPRPRPPASGISSSSASESRCSSSERAARHVRDQLEPVGEAEALRPLAVARAEVAEEARDERRRRRRRAREERLAGRACRRSCRRA